MREWLADDDKRVAGGGMADCIECVLCILQRVRTLARHTEFAVNLSYECNKCGGEVEVSDAVIYCEIAIVTNLEEQPDKYPTLRQLFMRAISNACPKTKIQCRRKGCKGSKCTGNYSIHAGPLLLLQIQKSWWDKSYKRSRTRNSKFTGATVDLTEDNGSLYHVVAFVVWLRGGHWKYYQHRVEGQEFVEIDDSRVRVLDQKEYYQFMQQAYLVLLCDQQYLSAAMDERNAFFQDVGGDSEDGDGDGDEGGEDEQDEQQEGHTQLGF